MALHERIDRDNALSTVHELKISDIAESRLKVIRTCRMASTTKVSLVDQIATDTGWAAAFDCMARRLRPDASADCEPLELTKLVQSFDLSDIRPLAAASCVFAHLCSEFSPYTDVAEETLDVAVQTVHDELTDLTTTASWDVAQWARSRTKEEVTLASLLHNVANLLPFKHTFRTQFLSAAMLEHLGLPHSVVANVAARSARVETR